MASARKMASVSVHMGIKVATVTRSNVLTTVVAVAPVMKIQEFAPVNLVFQVLLAVIENVPINVVGKLMVCAIETVGFVDATRGFLGQGV